MLNPRARTTRLTAPAVADASVESDPPWFADWALNPPDAGVVLWAHQPSADHVMIQYGSFPEAWTDWATAPRTYFDASVFLSIRREEDSPCAIAYTSRVSSMSGS